MSLFTLLTLAVGLSMDAFAVAVCKGLAMKKISFRHMALVGLWFGGFQAMMPLIGYILGAQFAEKIQAFDHWIAFAFLTFIGASMLKEAFGKEEEEADDRLDPKTMLILAVATSIDALAVGVSLAFLQVNVVASCSFIGVVTFVISAAGVKIGHVFGLKYKAKAEMAGGVILILIGLKILIEHLCG